MWAHLKRLRYMKDLRGYDGYPKKRHSKALGTYPQKRVNLVIEGGAEDP